MAYPVPAEFAVNQGFRSYATAGVTGRPDGSEIQYLVWLYGDYQPYGHAGADIACPIGTPVYAIADGIVVWADWGYKLPGDDSWGPSGYFKRWGMYKNFPGIVTVIWHPLLNKFSIYGHLSSNEIAPAGTAVREGQQIALSGNTKARGETVGPHLHIAVVGDFTSYSTGGKYIFGCEDPLPYFNTGSLSYASESIKVLEEIDVAAKDEIMARQNEIVAWENQRFNDLAEQSERNRNMLAGFVRDVVNAKETITPEQIDARFQELTAATKPEGQALFKGDQSPEVYAWDGSNGFRHIDQAEYLTLITAGAVLKELPQAIIQTAVGGK